MSVVAMSFYTLKRIDVNTISGIGKQMPITFFAFVICALSLAGLPLTVGFISKLYLIKAAYMSEGIWLPFLILVTINYKLKQLISNYNLLNLRL